MCYTGNFKYTPQEAAALWKHRILDFRGFVLRNKASAMEISYDRLVHDPENVLRCVCQLVGVDYVPEMLVYHKKSMTLFQNPHGHLSFRQLKEGLNTKSVGRWKSDLRNKDVKIIMDIAGELMHEPN